MQGRASHRQKRTPEQRKEAARKAAQARWAKEKKARKESLAAMKWKILTTDQRMELWFIILVVVGFIAAIILGWLMLR